MTGHDATTTALMLDAGAVLPAGTTDREDADVLTARTYTHPALDDRPVIRLVPGTLGEAEDLALEFLGLERRAEPPVVGQVRRETLGFPAWALVNDPANGHHALALVKDVERLARQAKSRAGAAKEGFEALADRLGRAVPHFLPTFHEQAARIFLRHENTTYAATFFGKAREAERVHGLTVDEDRQRAVFLEFAFAGALTVKALKEYVRDLARRLDPAEAWQQYRQLAVERCAAGLPPYSSLPQDARGLIKAAGVDRQAAEESFLADLIASPSVVRAPASFWKAYRAGLVELARREPAVRARLLEIMPTELGSSVADDESWLALLADSGATALLTDGPAAADGAPDGTAADAAGEGRPGGESAPPCPADWLARWAAHRKHGGATSGHSPATLDLVRRMAPRLRELGRPVDIFAARWRKGADLDLLDVAAAERIPLALPPAGTEVHLDLGRWLREDHPDRRDLTATADDPRLLPLLHRAVGDLGDQRTSRETLQRLAAHPVLSRVLHTWLDEAADRYLAATGLPAAREALSLLRPFRPVAVTNNPEAVSRVATHRTAPVLARTLRAGILDELGWPALDQALARLDTETRPASRQHHGNDTLVVADAWPALVLARGHKALVVGPDGILLDHDLRIPPGQDHYYRPHFRYVDGELLVLWWQDNKLHAYWSHRPTEVFTPDGEPVPRWWSGTTETVSVPLPDGGRATGGRTLHAGDTTLPPNRPVIGDGTTLWRQGRQGTQQVWLEYDPATGTHGRASLPALLRAGVDEDADLLHDHCRVLPLRPGLENTPFGTDGTLLGRWVREDRATGDRSAGTPDGRTVTLAGHAPPHTPVPLGSLALPGGAAPVAARSRGRVDLYAADDTGPTGALGHVVTGERGGEYASGTRMVPPLEYWHALRPRDEAASLALRALTDEQVTELLDTAATITAEHRAARARETADDGEIPTQRATEAGKNLDQALRAAVGAALPAVSDSRLLTGVLSLVRVTLRHAETAAEFTIAPTTPRPAADQEMFADHRPEHGDDGTLRQAVSQIGGGWWGGSGRWTGLRQIRAVNHVLSGNPAAGKPLHRAKGLPALTGGWTTEDRTVPGSSVDWAPLLERLRPLAYRAASPALAAHERAALLLLFQAISEGPLARAAGVIRHVRFSEPARADHRQERVGQVLRHGDRTVVVLSGGRVDRDTGRLDWEALDHDPSGRFGAIADFGLDSATPCTEPWTGERLAPVARLITDKGPAPWNPEAPAALAGAIADGATGPVETAVLLAALPHTPDTAVLAPTGLRTQQWKTGHSRLTALGGDTTSQLIGALLPDDPAQLWSTGPDTAAAAARWAELRGDRLRIPEDLALLGVVTGEPEAVLNPAGTPWLTRTTTQRVDEHGRLAADDPDALPNGRDLSRAVDALASLAYHLPHGDPLRARLPEGLAALRRRLDDPGLLVDLQINWTDTGKPTSAALRTAHHMPDAGGADITGLTPVGEVFVLCPWYGNSEGVLMRPAGVTGADDPVHDLVDGLVGSRNHGATVLRTLHDEGFARALAADGPPGHAQDPTRSAPGLVAEAAAALGLGEDAATLYLQLLALPDPTDRNCVRWTGWKPARTKRARAELAATELVVEAKRARAGRSLFLPCGWLDHKSPALPVETWKEALYPLPGRERAVPHLPVAELFALAWERVRSGDGPAYEQLTTRTTRKGRR
ncbi:hypothetical protein [Streptomyces spiramenti]|uniref:DNA-binding protein n=1 Tax=Streptomyces spiramenti TaxID=2720606 RepID=A0ABX1AEV8_9ACTN|nr:hypothetical protein [Streptomyces spiramenti]NJP65737.1 hypothetical protein [Streptomyces spiramenti]